MSIAGATVAPLRREPAFAEAATPAPTPAEATAPPAQEPPPVETATPPAEERRPTPAEAAAPPAEEPPLAEAAAPPAEEAPTPAEATAPPAEKPPPAEAVAPPKPSQKIELIIDSLQSFELGKPIPVLVERLAEKKFKATVPDSDISSTAPTMGEAFLQLKDHIERSFGKYHNQRNLEPDQQRQLEVLQKYVVREKRRSGWSFR